MTKTLVVTHAEGMLACFTQESDGSLRQRALLDIGEQTPTAVALAKLGADLAANFGWQRNGSRTLDGPPIRALEAAKKRNPIQRTSANAMPRKVKAAEIKERREAVLAYIKAHPNATVTETLVALGVDAIDSRTRGRWFWTFRKLRDEGIIVVSFTSRNPNRSKATAEHHFKVAK